MKRILFLSLIFGAVHGFGFPYSPGGGGGGGAAIGGAVSLATPCAMLYAGASGVLAQDPTHLCYDYTNFNLHIGTIPADMSGFGPGLTIKQGYSILFPSNDFVLGASGDLGAITHSGSAFNIDTYETGATTGGTINVGRAAAGGTLNLGALAEAAVNIYGVIANVNSTTAYFAGNVGIGTSSPGYKLNLSSGVIFNDGVGAGIYTTGNSTATVFVGQLKGTITNDNASAGNVGQVISSATDSGHTSSLTTATPKTIVSMSLTAGDWDVAGVVDYVTSGATTSDFKSGSSSTNNTFGAQDTFLNLPLIGTALSDTIGHALPVVQYSLSGTTTVYLIAQANFSVGTSTAYGTIRARRVR